MPDLYYLPQTGDDLENIDLAEARMPGYTWRVDPDTDRVKGMTDLADALRQTVYHILSIERYRWAIYPQRYGSEIADLIGTAQDYAAAELQRTITEALIQDDRVTDCGNFSFDFPKGTVVATFTVETIYGELEIQGELTR